MVEEEAEKASADIPSGADFEDSGQQVATILASDRHYWRGYDDGLDEIKLAYQRGYFFEFLNQTVNQKKGILIANI